MCVFRKLLSFYGGLCMTGAIEGVGRVGGWVGRVGLGYFRFISD